MSYLQEVITDVLENYSDQAERLLFVTTGKRPALFLKKHFAQQVKHATIAPEFIGIADLFTRISGVQSISNLSLLFEFYDCYKTTCKDSPDTFEEFLSWGQTALKDFSEIDQYLVKPDKLFPYIHALKEAEHWSGFDKELTDMQKKHLEFWNTLGDYYFALNKRLDELGKGYGGFIAKKAVEKLPEYIQTQADTIHIFVGFNALSEAEQKIIQSILMDIGGEIYWDGDTYFLNNSTHDAGFFLRKYLKNWRYYETHTPKFIQSNYEKEKELYLTGVPKSINQAHSVAELLKNIPTNELESTALIIADENLLIPVLQAVQTKTSVNITMGYPLQQTPLNDLFVAYFRLQLSKSSFYHKDILNLLSQPFLHTLLSENVVREISQYIKTHNLTYITHKKLFEAVEKIEDITDTDCKMLRLLFPEGSGKSFVTTLIDNAIVLIYRLKEQLNTENNTHILIQEYAYRFYQLFNQLKQLQEQYSYIDTVKTLYHFYLDVLQKSALNFRGEPLEGLQVMGVLESRSLDFKRVIITSVNEGVLPLGKSDNSLIPYDVKYVLGLPTFKERDAVYSYNFYRILQRAEQIYLFYDTEMNGFKNKEKSRFILQLLAEKIPTHKVVHQIKAPEVYPAVLSPLTIAKTESVIESLKALAEKGISPSALTTYIRNPMTFYQQNVLHIYEEREVEETVEARTFGNIVHGTLEDLYCPFLNEVLTQENIKKMQPLVVPTIERRFEEEYRSTDFRTGKNWLIFNVIEKYVRSFLALELAEIKNGTEIIPLYLEEKIKVPFQTPHLPFPVNFKGIIDRVDRRNGKLHIIDYKTGIVEPNDVRIKDWESLITDIKYGKAFQLLTYAYMFTQHFKIDEPMRVANLSFKRLQKGLLPFHTYIDKVREEDVTSQTLALYTQYTEQLLQEIFDINTSFSEKV
ncbi:hypothetical protein RCZ04_21890 [Capnocytophaga sp. HP1101]